MLQHRGLARRHRDGERRAAGRPELQHVRAVGLRAARWRNRYVF
jgi:hypothetical protein